MGIMRNKIIFKKETENCLFLIVKAAKKLLLTKLDTFVLAKNKWKTHVNWNSSLRTSSKLLALKL